MESENSTSMIQDFVFLCQTVTNSQAKVCALSIGLLLRGINLARKRMGRLTDWLNMTLTVLTGP